ncbi:MarR family winged helix-turn-helix transcriptional regulator [Gordonia insulae]|uniref:Organic hydroperoxide resistance transcriptional regulator n=1 Tax=Gordonia insulae TaxID=2420509 RepID=A0A3G8JFI2_9ACTN|nr:MarR family transcriptional regulator [Gordonia insulae]AZG43921.1 Organic hydroperoxide resistance transcriptional regulator [Gordonia insulae]
MTSVRLDEQLCFALYTASRAVIAAQRPGLAELGLTYPQYLAMLVLWEEDEISVSRLCRRLQLDSGTVSPLLRRLEAQGYLSRRRSSDDERSVTVSLTPEGAALGARADCVYDSLVAAIADAAHEESAQEDSAQEDSADARTDVPFDADALIALRTTLHDLTDELRRHLGAAAPSKGTDT